MTHSIYKANQNFGLNEVILDNWEILIKIKLILKPFYIITKYEKGNVIKKSYGAL